MLRTVLLILVICVFAQVQPARAQGDSIQPGVTIERTLARGQSHSFTIKLEADQFLQVVVEQHGIDVIVRAFGPESKLLTEVDSPNGTEGPESISIVSDVAGAYRIEVAPLGQVVDAAPGRYELKVVELRHATEQEISAGKNGEVLKASGLALIHQVVDEFNQIRLPQTRVRAQLQAAQMVWASDEKLANKLASDAIEGVKEFIAGIDISDENYNQNYWVALQLRREVSQILGNHDPELALRFLQVTRTLPNPEGRNVQWDQELSMEVALGTQLAAKDPNRAAQMLRDSLKRGYSPGLVDGISRLRLPQPELASQLAKEVVAKLMGEKLLRSQDLSNLTLSLLRVAQPPVRNYQTSSGHPPPAKSDSALLSDQEYRDLFEKAVTDALAFAGPANVYTPEKGVAQNLLSSLKSMDAELKLYAPDKVAAIEKRNAELNAPNDPQSALWQKYQETINNQSVDEGMEEVGRSPEEIREQLYQVVAQRAANNGDLVRARQIIKDNISNVALQRQLLVGIEQQEIYANAAKGKFEDAFRGVSNLRTTRERAQIISQLVNQIGPGLKRAQILTFLDQARTLVSSSGKVESQEQMGALLEIARSLSPYDSRKAFEIVEPLLEQFGEMSNAAQVLDGFVQDFYQDGELQLNNGTALANMANQLVQSLGWLATANFDRARADAERFERPELRIVAYLGIAQQAISQESRNRIANYGRGFRN